MREEPTPGIPEPPDSDNQLEETQEIIAELHDDLKGLAKDLEQTEAREALLKAEGRNFEIKAKDNTLILVREGEEDIDLGKELPDGVRFEVGEVFEHGKDKGKSIVRYPADQIDSRGFMLSIFHELGHAALHADPHYQIDLPFLTRLRAAKDLTLNTLKALRLTRVEKETGGKKKKVFHLAPNKDIDDCVPAWFEAEESQLVEKKERDSWAFGLRRLRQLDRKGYNVFAGFDKNTQIKAYVTFALLTYKTDAFISGLRRDISDVHDTLKDS
ncbi:hypothetical protein ACFL0Z_01470 [Patescibacteria group bacterium]